nr:GFA family protein [uncultured Amphritea sp.]
MNTPILAQCTCGNFQFTSTSEPTLQLTCHCEQCRQASKVPFTNLAFFKMADTEVKGKTVVHNFTADSGAKTVRETCATCGEILLDRTDGFPGMIGIVAERIQAPYEFQVQCHVWIGSKSAGITIPEGTETFAGNA